MILMIMIMMIAREREIVLVMVDEALDVAVVEVLKEFLQRLRYE